jgi:negative regulator of sigma E activity
MKSMKVRNKQSGFLAVGVGLLLTAVFGVTAMTVTPDNGDQQIVEQPDAQVQQLAQKNSDR